ncbi:MAG: M14 family zinc carboxypeptidase, partial [Clostridia bacterium]|nr:M14 family zinc carboxypeptidase [Clostridia bacterium]
MKDTKDMKSSNELYSIFIITIFLILCLFLNACSLIPSKEEDSPPGTSPDPAAAKTYSPIVLEDHTSDLYGGTWIASCNEYLPLRQEPSGASKLVGRVLKGDTVQLIAYDSLFAKVNYEGKEGYVMAAYLVPANEESHNKELQIIKAVESYSYEQMTADLQSLADAYPAKLTIDSIGKSELGKDIPIAILGDTSASHHILVHGAIHGREHMTSTLIMSQMEYLLSHKNTKFLESSIKDALNDVCLHLIPMVNPDGVEI